MTKIVVGVWKDKLDWATSVRMAQNLARRSETLDTTGFTSAIAPAPYAAAAVSQALRGTAIAPVYQDVHWPADSGSYIGSTPIRVADELHFEHAMVGHSERRRFFAETDNSIHRKLLGLLAAGITPILCIGDDVEDWSEREEILTSQLTGALRSPGLEEVDLSRLVVAYEPVWAISTWRSARDLPTGTEVSRMLDLVRDVAARVAPAEYQSASYLFGGSVGPKNAEEYFSTDGVDGALVGGASLDEDSLHSVFEAAAAAWGQ